MKVNQSNTESKKFQIPMMVTDEVIRDFGIKPEDVTWRRIGNRKCRVVMVDATEEEYRAYMAPIWAEIKREDRTAAAWSRERTAGSSAARKATAVRSASASRRPAVSGISPPPSPY